VAGRTYRAEYKDDLTAPTWTPLGNPSVANLDRLTFTDNMSAHAQRFYRE
jgi:hypothetical protein